MGLLGVCLIWGYQGQEEGGFQDLGHHLDDTVSQSGERGEKRNAGSQANSSR